MSQQFCPPGVVVQTEAFYTRWGQPVNNVSITCQVIPAKQNVWPEIFTKMVIFKRFHQGLPK